MENKYSVDVWNEYYTGERKIHIKPRGGFFSSYDIFLCDTILAKYLLLNKEKRGKIKICEIGCGDGKLLKKNS
jgi:SAM-dependent MidA family methyltransferase